MAEAPAADAAVLAEQQRVMEARFVSMVKVVLTGASVGGKGRGPVSELACTGPRLYTRVLTHCAACPTARKLRSDNEPAQVAPRVFLGSVGVSGLPLTPLQTPTPSDTTRDASLLLPRATSRRHIIENGWCVAISPPREWGAWVGRASRRRGALL